MNDNDVIQPPGQPPDQARDQARDAGDGQQALPFETAADDPITYALTARARREVAPASLPPLEVLPDDGVVTIEPGDTRPARARALCRAGVPLDRIAREIGADDLLVRAWCADIGVRGAPRLRVVERPEPTGPASPTTDPDAVAWEQQRRAARDESSTRLASAPPAFVGGLGLTVASAEWSLHALVVTLRDRDVAAGVVRWLVDHAGADPRRLRVVLRVGPDLAGDVALHAWASALGLPPERVVSTRWRGAPAPAAVEALVRVADPAVAARVAGWHDGLLDRLGVPLGDDASTGLGS